MLAIAVKKASKNQYYLQVYNSYTLESIKLSGGKSFHNASITEILWGPDDQFVATCGMDGQVFEYSISYNDKDGGWDKKELKNDLSVKLNSMTYTYDPTDIQGNGYAMYVVSGVKDNRGVV